MSNSETRVLLVEDDDTKRRRIEAVIALAIPKAMVTISRSYQTAVQQLPSVPYDLVILDMTLPTFDREIGEAGGRPRVFGGRDLLSEIVRLELDTKVVVVTQYARFAEHKENKSLDQLRSELQDAFPRHFRGAIYYSSMQSDWEARLAARLQKLAGVP